jgi:hypothetical protein
MDYKQGAATPVSGLASTIAAHRLTANAVAGGFDRREQRRWRVRRGGMRCPL